MSTDLVTAAKAKAMKDMGKTYVEVGEMLDISDATVKNIVKGYGKWGELTSNDPLFAKIYQQQKDIWRKSLWTLKAKILPAMELQVDKASLRDLAVTLGIITEKQLLLAGESTQNVEIHHHVEVEGLDAAADRLAHSLLRFSADSNAVSSPQNEPIDVTPEPNNIRSEGKDK